MSGVTNCGEMNTRLAEIRANEDGLQTFFTYIGTLSAVALFIISCVAAAHHFDLSGVVLGGCLVGFGAAALLSMLAKVARAKDGLFACVHAPSIIQMVAMTVLGALALSGTVAPAIVGYAGLGITLSFGFITCVLSSCVGGRGGLDINNDIEAEIKRAQQERGYEDPQEDLKLRMKLLKERVPGMNGLVDFTESIVQEAISLDQAQQEI